ncbi:MAG TPA: glutathione S-transferase family protein [Solirubrobacterales bacterium]|nr:glutathione S-transferase family protein [Solirubrobacterales bacterium]
MGIKLYGTQPSPPSHTVRLELEAKGLDYEPIWLLPGLHPALLRTRGFRGGTVPAVKLDGRKVQESRAISRVLDELKPEPPLFPADPQKRLEVEEAERWGDETLQNVPRRIVRWLSVHRPETRLMIAREIGVPLPKLAAWINAPTARYMANKVDSDEEIQNAVAAVPEVLDHVDELIAKGTIGGEQPNAADFQIATSVRALLTVRDLDDVTGGRPAAEHAMKLVPEFGNDFPAGLLPAEFARGRATARPD